MPEYQYDAWFGLMVPAKTPPAIVKKINEDIATVMKDPELQKRWETLTAVPLTNTPEQFDAIIRADADRYGKLLKAAGVSVELNAGRVIFPPAWPHRRARWCR